MVYAAKRALLVYGLFGDFVSWNHFYLNMLTCPHLDVNIPFPFRIQCSERKNPSVINYGSFYVNGPSFERQQIIKIYELKQVVENAEETSMCMTNETAFLEDIESL